jgi:hypothetical protein
MRIDHGRLITAGKRSARVAGGVYLLVVFAVAVARVAVRFGVRVPGIPAPATPTDVGVGLMDDVALAAAFGASAASSWWSRVGWLPMQAP